MLDHSWLGNLLFSFFAVGNKRKMITIIIYNRVKYVHTGVGQDIQPLSNTNNNYSIHVRAPNG